MLTSQSYLTGYPLQKVFTPFPFVSFTLALVTDLLFWKTANLMWQNFSAWLLFAGLVFGAIALIAGAVDALRPSTRMQRPSLPEILGFVLVLALAVVNSLVHARDGWTAVVPAGLALSAATFVLMLLTLFLAMRARGSRDWRMP